MTEEAFSEMAYHMWDAVPSPYKERIVNVALLIEDVATDDDIADGAELLGLYRGIPRTERGEAYGVGMTLPDTITLYRLPILEEAKVDTREGETYEAAVRRVTAETLWHEVGHYFGLSEEEIHEREDEGTNLFGGNAQASPGV